MSSPLNWDACVWPESVAGRLMAVLERLPRAHWSDSSTTTRTSLLAYACCGHNPAAALALLAHGLDVNAVDGELSTAVRLSVVYNQPRMLTLMCVAGADLHVVDGDGLSPIALALVMGRSECAEVLMANGVRLASVCPDVLFKITPVVRSCERGVLACRAAAVVLLGLKRRRGDALRVVDRWMVMEITRAVWATRCDKGWQFVP